MFCDKILYIYACKTYRKMGKPKKNQDEARSLPMYVAGRVKGSLKEKIIQDQKAGKTQQEIITEALNLLYGSNSY